MLRGAESCPPQYPNLVWGKLGMVAVLAFYVTWVSCGGSWKRGLAELQVLKNLLPELYEAGRESNCSKLLVFPHWEIHISKGIWLLFSILILYLS